MVDADTLRAAELEQLLFLAPERPRSVSVAGSVELDDAIVERWGLRLQPAGGADLALVGPGATARPDAPAIVSSPPTAPDVPAGAGYRTQRYTRRRTGDGELVAWPAGVPTPTRLARRWRTRPMAEVVVASRGATAPAAVRASQRDGVVVQVTTSADARRRVAYLVAPSMLRRPRWVVKASVGGNAQGRFAEEQAALCRLHDLGLGDRVPEACGSGDVDGLGWSAETVAPGVLMVRAGRPWWRVHGLSTIESVARWLEDVAVRSVRQPPPRAELRHRGIEVVGEAADWVRAPAGDVLRVVAVTTHGDLGTGQNILVRGRRFTVIDWETADEDGLPLGDLVPFLCWALARRRGLRSASEQARFAVALCAGEVRESPWVFATVDRYLARLGLQPRHAGPLAAVAWAHHGSMRARHDDLLRAAGHDPTVWVSMAEQVLSSWMQDPRLGAGWRALVDDRERS